MDLEPQDIFQVENLKVTYRFRTAVEALTLSLRPGKSLALLGVNGAGKTSTIRALLGMLRPKAGKVTVFGGPAGDPKSFRDIGFAPEEAVPPEYLSAGEYLRFVGAFRQKDREKRNREADDLVGWFDLDPAKKIRDYSKGMKRRLVLAQALLGGPKLLILDEPLNGLDPIVIMKLRERLTAYREAGGSILYSSHILAEVEKTCTDVAILSAGRLMLCDPMEKILAEYGSVEKAFAEKVGNS